MKDIFSTIGKIAGLVFGAVVIGFTAWLTWLLAQRIIPGNPALQVMTVALFDGGALVWFTLFLTQAKGTLQWAISGIGFAVGLLGAVIMAAGELVLGQSLVVLEDTTQIGWILVATVIIAALAHCSLTYFFHLADPHTLNRIENAQHISKAIDAAYHTGRAEIDRQAEAMGAELARSVVYEAKAQLSAAALPHLRRADDLEAERAEAVIIPGTSRPAETTPRRRPLYAFNMRRNGNHKAARTFGAEVETPGFLAEAEEE